MTSLTRRVTKRRILLCLPILGWLMFYAQVSLTRRDIQSLFLSKRFTSNMNVQTKLKTSVSVATNVSFSSNSTAKLKTDSPVFKSTLKVRNNGTAFLTAVINVRIYEYDKAKLTTTELRQWIDYMFYAGVEQIYLYDCYKFPNESLAAWCAKYYPHNVLYHDWGLRYPYSLQWTKMTAYDHAIKTYRNAAKWQIAFDMDEYPFIAKDTNPGFLERFLRKKEISSPNISEWSVKNFLFLGKPKPFKHILRRYLRRTPYPSNNLDKPIYRTADVKKAACHHNGLFNGKRSMDVDPREIRMNHYWGGRLQNWGDDTEEIISKTIYDDSILVIVDRLEQKSNYHV